MTRTSPTYILALVLAACSLAACGSEGIDLDAEDQGNEQMVRGAELFADRCSGCHTLGAAGAQGSATKVRDQERVDGPNFNTRPEDRESVLYAIRNGGFSGAIMPQNIVVGEDAEAVAAFLERYAGRDVASTPAQSSPPAGDG